MSDNLQPHSDETIEARITAWVLGEASPFEAAELEALVENSPELKLFHNRIRTLHTLLAEADTTSNSSSQEWKLPSEKREKLNTILGSTVAPIQPVSSLQRESRIRRASFRAAIGIAACFVVTFIISRLYVFPRISGSKESAMIVSYMAKEDSAVSAEADIAQLRRAVREQEDQVEESRKLLTTISRTMEITYNGERGVADERKLESLERSIDTQDYVDAKRDFETDQALLEQMKLSLVGKEIEQNVVAENITVTPNFESDRRDDTSQKKPQAPSAAMSKVVASTTDTPSSIPLPDLAVVDPSVDFGDGSDLGGGWGGKDASQERSADFRRRESALSDNQPSPSPKPEAAQDVVNIGGQVRTPGPQGFQEGLTLGDAVASAGRATEFGSAKPAKVFRDGKTTTYDLSKDEFAQVELKPGDTIEMPQKNWLGCGASRDELARNSAGEKAKAPHDAPQEPRQDTITGEVGQRELQEELAILPMLPDVTLYSNRQLAAMDSSAALPPAPAEKPSRPAITASNSGAGNLGKEWKSVEDGIAAAKSDYDSAAFDNTNAELSMQVDKDRELSVPEEFKRNADFSPQPEDESQKLGELNAPFPDGDLEGSINYGSPVAAPEDSDMYGQARAGVQLKNSFNDNPSKGEKTWNMADRFSDGTVSGDYENGKGYAFYDNSASGGLAFRVQDAPQAASNFEGGLRAGTETVTRSGSKATIEVLREFIYPTEYEPAELPNLWKESDKKPNSGVDNEDIRKDGLKSDQKEEATRVAANDRVPLLDEIPQIGRLFQKPKIDLADLSQEIPANQEPFSTFSLNISDTSFQIARAAIAKGERPDPASIKPEQFYNAIDYGDPAPSSREPVAAAIDQTAHPVIPGRNLVRIAVRTASTGRSAAQPLRLTLLVDQSGSMVREDRRAAMDAALEQLATLLTEQDRITVIGFSRTPRLLADSLPGNQANKLSDLINQTASEGGTNLEQAINLASELALRHKLDGAQNRIVLFTDGAANLGNANPERLSEKIETLRQQGLAFDIAGIGTNDLNDNLLAELARHGNGRYYLVGENTGASLAAQLAGAFRPAAENVKVQVKLNPERVGNYKLIGFEKDRLKTEDFRNDSVDAAELAADEAGVAMYQVETLPEGSGEIGEVSVRFRDTASGEMVERTWTIPYDATTPAFDKADPKTQLATLSLLAAQKLQPGPLADAISFRNFAETIARLRQTYKADPKTQQLLNLLGALK